MHVNHFAERCLKLEVDFCLATAIELAALCSYVTEFVITFDHTVIQQHVLA